jgi:hypothetical protein
LCSYLAKFGLKTPENSVEEETHSFIIRIWDIVDGPGKRPEETWRGSIDYVGSGKRLYFNDLNSIATFIKEQVRAETPQAVAHWEALVKRSRVGHRFNAFWSGLLQKIKGWLCGRGSNAPDL